MVRQRLAYIEPWFDRWSTPRALALLEERNDLELVGLPGEASLDDQAAWLGEVHGYQIPPGVDLDGSWYGSCDLLVRCPTLMAICTTGSGVDVVDVDACNNLGIIVCNQAGLNKEAVAEHTVGLMLSLSKRIGIADKLLRRPDPHDYLSLRGTNIFGKVLGIVGFSHIGRRVAQICQRGFGMKVLASDPYVPAEDVRTSGATKVELDEIFSSADFVSLHCALTPETTGLVGYREFAMMKRTAFFISTARGGVHDEAALAQALSEGRIAGAGLDVFTREPPEADDPLLQFDNVVASPHIAGMTQETIADMSVANALQWLTIFGSEVPPRLVNRQAWPAYQQRFEETFGSRPPDLS